MYEWLIKPLLFLFPAEAAHRLALWTLRFAFGLPLGGRLLKALWAAEDPALNVTTLGVRFPNPVVLAAGFDKHAESYAALCALGFGAVEVGTITGQPQRGNPRPRLFRLPEDRALLNRMGFNNCGAEAAQRRLSTPRNQVVGVNIGKTKLVPDAQAIDDYVASAERLGPLADYLVVNVSSPNTPGLRDLQAVDRLRPLLVAVQEALTRVCGEEAPALLVKIAPDLDDEAIVLIADLALELGLAGIVATNTTVGRSGLVASPAELSRLGNGGVSGAPLKGRALDVLRLLRGRVGSRLTLVAAGGIESADDAWERLAAGATLVQLYSAVIYAGPSLPGRVARGLLERATAAGFDTVQEAIDGLHGRLAAATPRSGEGAP